MSGFTNACGPVKFSGATPMMVKSAPFRRILRPKDRTVARERAVPHVITDDRYQIPARDGVFIGAEPAPEHRLDAQSAEEIPADAGVEAVLRNLVHLSGDSGEKEVITGQGLERFRAIAQVDVIRIGQAPQPRVRRGRVDLDNPA